MSGVEVLLMFVAFTVGFLLYRVVRNAIHARRNRREATR